MKKSTKMLISLTSSLLIAGNVLAMSSCKDSAVSGINVGNVKSVAYDGSKITISFYHCMGSALKGILQDCIKDFNKLYPNIEVKEKSFGDYPGVRDQITKEVAADKAPSLAYCYPDHVAVYQTAKVVLPLDDFINHTGTASGTNEVMGLTQAQKDDYVPTYYAEGAIYGDKDGDGTNEMYTLPMLKSTELLYYNKTYFKENNLEVPRTWDEMEETCKKILEIESAKEGGLAANPCIPLGYDSGANWFITMTEQLGSAYTSNEKGNYFLFNNEANRKFVERFRDWYDKDYVTTEEIFGSYTSDLFTETAQKEPKAYMCIGSSAGASYQTPTKNNGAFPFEVGVAMVPQEALEGEDYVNAKGETVKYQSKMISQGPSLCLFKKQSEQEMSAAWLFAKYITTTVKHQARFSMQNGYTCAVQSVTEDPVYSEFLDMANLEDGSDYTETLQAASVKMTMQLKDYYYVSPAFNGSSKARDKMADLMEECMKGKAGNGQSAADFIKEEFDDVYKELKRKYDKD